MIPGHRAKATLLVVKVHGFGHTTIRLIPVSAINLMLFVKFVGMLKRLKTPNHTNGKKVMEPEHWPVTYEMSIDWGRKARSQAMEPARLSYMGMLLTCPAQVCPLFIIEID